MPLLGEVCGVCAEPLSYGDEICHHCEVQLPAFERVTAAYRYAWPLNILVTGFKFDGHYLYGDSLAKLMVRRFAGMSSAADLVVPTPLHPQRLAERGYNQSEFLAEKLAEYFQRPLERKLLVRTVNTEAQSGKNRRQRLANLNNAFKVTRRLHGERVAVVDDVLTTGVTADRMANTLLKAGASSVEVWVLARTANE